MLKRFTLLIVLLITYAGANSQTRSENLFYMVNTPESFESFRANVSQISIVCPQTFLVSKEGTLSGTVDQRVLALAKANNVKVMPLIVNSGFDQKLLHDIVTNPVARKRSIEMMLEYAKKYDLDGWQFDLEGLSIRDMADFTLYFKETAEALHKNKLQLSAALVHATENVGGSSAYHLFLYENWRAGYDFKALAEIGDFISIMTYDQHTRRTPPGPVASPEWMEKVIKHLLAQGVKPEKLSMGIPNYSVHWFTDFTAERGGFANGRSAKYPMVQQLLGQNNAKKMWHEKGQVNWATWDNEGVYEYLFIEDAQSLKPKLDLLKKYKLRGISVWVLGGEDPEWFTVLKKETVRK
ncbi:glycosyl hydrolase family 18 protein [Daejeonella lutea]|uniref:Spore germination protein YaaH n=1 Tax=Daejeonella lutea TaxID=572036 RepID=A0A1T4ZXJ1_9SPHI|nr:glycosyl hydrolase family 18 protein [Daejeonella lutea]SKB27247.1 Spore germination protein YaaH [Daejeonella lutea]